MKALREVSFDGIVIPDHVLGGGYPAANNAYTIGYMKALRGRVNTESKKSRPRRWSRTAPFPSSNVPKFLWADFSL